jgi:hypothetical protein
MHIGGVSEKRRKLGEPFMEEFVPHLVKRKTQSTRTVSALPHDINRLQFLS